jgi:hypothetical protein
VILFKARSFQFHLSYVQETLNILNKSGTPSRILLYECCISRIMKHTSATSSRFRITVLAHCTSSKLQLGKKTHRQQCVRKPVAYVTTIKCFILPTQARTSVASARQMFHCTFIITPPSNLEIISVL